MTAVAALLVLPLPSHAAPTGGTVVAGAAGITQSGNTTNISQSTNSAVINGQGFSIAPQETVNFNQPSAASVTLNRVIGNEESVIAGALNANGQVFIQNSAGVLFTRSAQVNVGGLVASTLDISNDAFMGGNYTFSGDSAASVTNQGRIHASPGGYVALLGKTVSNQGVITATLGTVAMASGDKITLNYGGDSLVDVTIDEGTLNALVENKQLIKADGGQVIMTAEAADAVLSAQVNNSGIVQAQTMAALTGGGTVHVGAIKLVAENGTTNVAGTLDASAPQGGDGGTIETSGSTVHVVDGAVVTSAAASGKAGNWLVDPDGFTIAASGGDITGTALATQLGNGNVTLTSTGGSGTDGNITVNAAVSWSANTMLTLDATNSINIKAAITATGASAGLALNFGGFAANGSVTAGTNYNVDAPVTLSGASAALSINGQAYTLIQSMSALQTDINGNVSGFYALGQDIDASSAGTFSGPVVTALTGTLAGLGHTISNLTITDSAGTGVDALIGQLGSTNFGATIVRTASVRDIGLANANISDAVPPAQRTGTLVAMNWGVISNANAANVTVFANIPRAGWSGGTSPAARSSILPRQAL